MENLKGEGQGGRTAVWAFVLGALAVLTHCPIGELLPLGEAPVGEANQAAQEKPRLSA